MNLAGLSAAYPGFMAARQQDARTQAQELTNQDAMDDRASMEALGRAFGMPQQAPPPQGAGQPSVPRQPAPQPQMAPQGNPAAPSPQSAAPMPIPAPGGPPTGMPVGNAPPPQPQQAPPRPPMPQGAPGGMPAPQGGGQPQGGMMSLEQLTQRIRTANPGIEKNPRIFVKALERGQVLLAPEGRQELAAAKQQLAAQALDMKMQQFEATLAQKQATQLTAAEKLDMQGRVLDLKRELAQAAQAGLDRRGAEAREARLDLLIASIAGKKELQGQKDEAADKRLGLTLDNKTAIAAAHDAVRKELGNAKGLTDPNLIGGTLWYRQRMIELKERGLADAAAKAQMDHDVKLVQEEGRSSRATAAEEGRNTRSTDAIAGRQSVADTNAASRQRVAEGAAAVRRELGEGALKLGADKLKQTQWYQKRMTALKELGLEDAAAKVQLDHEMKLLQEEGRNDRTTQVEAGRTSSRAEKAREFDISDATKRAASETRLKAVAAKATAGDITDEEATFYSKALRTDPAMVMRLMGAGGMGTAAKQRIARAFMQDPANKPEDLAKAEIILSGKKAGMQTAERQGAKVDIGAEEIKTFGPKVISAAKAVNPSKFPTWNSLQQAVDKGTGSPEVVALNDAITNYRNALIQVAQRGGATSEGAQTRADQYLNRTMSLKQIIAAIQSGKAEADVAQSAVRKVTGNIVKSVEPDDKETPESTPSAGAGDDPLGWRK